MTVKDIKVILARKARREWPWAAKASDLPFPDYWKSATEYMSFHAQHVGAKLLEQIAADIVFEAAEAQRRNVEPKPWVVPEKVKAIWAAATERQRLAAQARRFV